MDTTTVIVIVAVVVVLAIAVAAYLMSKRRTEQRRARAEQLRLEADAQAGAVDASAQEAAAAEARAEVARAEAERAEQQAAEARQGLHVDEARREDALRRPTRVDPDVDHRCRRLPSRRRAEQGRRRLGRRSVVSGHEPGARSDPRPAGAALPGRPARPGAARPDHARLRPAAQHDVPPPQRDDRGGLRRAPAPTSTASGSASRPSRSAAATPARSRCSGSRGGRWPTSSTGSASPRTSRSCTAATCSTSSRSARPGRPPLVTDVGVRLPAHLTASGRAILALLPASQVRALYPGTDDFVDRHGRGPRTLSALRTRARPTPGSAATPSRTAR